MTRATPRAIARSKTTTRATHRAMAGSTTMTRATPGAMTGNTKAMVTPESLVGALARPTARAMA